MIKDIRNKYKEDVRFSTFDKMSGMIAITLLVVSVNRELFLDMVKVALYLIKKAWISNDFIKVLIMLAALKLLQILFKKLSKLRSRLRRFRARLKILNRRLRIRLERYKRKLKQVIRLAYLLIIAYFFVEYDLSEKIRYMYDDILIRISVNEIVEKKAEPVDDVDIETNIETGLSYKDLYESVCEQIEVERVEKQKAIDSISKITFNAKVQPLNEVDVVWTIVK